MSEKFVDVVGTTNFRDPAHEEANRRLLCLQTEICTAVDFWTPETVPWNRPGAPERNEKDWTLMEAEARELGYTPLVWRFDSKEATLWYKTSMEGKGWRKPKKNETVKVHYTGWTYDGTSIESDEKVFDRSKTAVEFPVGAWTR